MVLELSASASISKSINRMLSLPSQTSKFPLVLHNGRKVLAIASMLTVLQVKNFAAKTALVFFFFLHKINLCLLLLCQRETLPPISQVIHTKNCPHRNNSLQTKQQKLIPSSSEVTRGTSASSTWRETHYYSEISVDHPPLRTFFFERVSTQFSHV